MNIPNTLNMILKHIYQGKNNELCNLPINENNAIKKMSFKNTNFIFY
jgi:F420-dependent methylenetetrahydromethanopterin dehydrogenase